MQGKGTQAPGYLITLHRGYNWYYHSLTVVLGILINLDQQPTVVSSSAEYAQPAVMLRAADDRKVVGSVCSKVN